MSDIKESFKKFIISLRDELHDFGANLDEVAVTTQDFYKAITGDNVKETFDEDGNVETFEFPEWDEFKIYWDKIESDTDSLSDDRINEIIKFLEIDIYFYETNEKIKLELVDKINENISNGSMNKKDIENWLNNNSFKTIIKTISENNKDYSVNDIINLIKESDEINSKFNVEDEVFYTPELSGFDNSKPLTIEFKSFESPEPIMGEDTHAEWYYSFKDSNLRAVESDLTSNVEELSTDDEELEDEDIVNENIHQDMKRLFHLQQIKNRANDLYTRFGLTDVQSIKNSLNETLSPEEYNIVLEDVYTALSITIENDYKNEMKSVNENLKEDIYKKLL